MPPDQCEWRSLTSIIIHSPILSGPNSGTLDTDGGLNCIVKWEQESLASLGGKKVRLRIHLGQQEKNVPRLFAISVKSKVSFSCLCLQKNKK